MYDRLAAYEIAKEATSILELALWKKQNEERLGKRARISEDVSLSYREQCRMNCGADIIIWNVLPYLLPKEITIPSDIEEEEDKEWTSGGVTHVHV